MSPPLEDHAGLYRISLRRSGVSMGSCTHAHSNTDLSLLCIIKRMVVVAMDNFEEQRCHARLTLPFA
jgi:hypothetical protein